VIFKPDVPLKQLYIGIHSTESKMPAIKESMRRSSMESRWSEDEEEEPEDLNKDIEEYLHRDEPHLTRPLDVRSERSESVDASIREKLTEGLDASGSENLSKGFSFLSYLIPTTQRGSQSATPRPSLLDSFMRKSFGSMDMDSESVTAPEPVTSRAASADDVDIDNEIEGWDFDVSDSRGPLSPRNLDFDKASPVISPLASPEISPLSNIRKMQTFPLRDDDPNAIVMGRSGVSDSRMSLKKQVSYKLEPKSDDKPLREWKSPNLSPSDTSDKPRRVLLARASSRTMKEQSEEEELDKVCMLYSPLLLILVIRISLGTGRVAGTRRDR
jgi:hypothetical protein